MIFGVVEFTYRYVYGLSTRNWWRKRTLNSSSPCHYFTKQGLVDGGQLITYHNAHCTDRWAV